jgi:hypothetical protein
MYADICMGCMEEKKNSATHTTHTYIYVCRYMYGLYGSMYADICMGCGVGLLAVAGSVQ